MALQNCPLMCFNAFCVRLIHQTDVICKLQFKLQLLKQLQHAMWGFLMKSLQALSMKCTIIFVQHNSSHIAFFNLFEQQQKKIKILHAHKFSCIKVLCSLNYYFIGFFNKSINNKLNNFQNDSYPDLCTKIQKIQVNIFNKSFFSIDISSHLTSLMFCYSL